MPPTLDGVLLVGWMERDQAVAFLRNDCHFDPSLTDAELEALWQPYRTRVEQLPDRPPTMPQTFSLSAEEQRHAVAFLAFLRQAGNTDVQNVVKVDLRQVAVHQLYVVTERSEGYKLRCSNPAAWLSECLPTSAPQPAPVRLTYRAQALSSEADFDVPHGEWVFGPTSDPSKGLMPQQAARHITMMRSSNNRMLLWSGYHRSYALVLSIPPTANVWPAFAAFSSMMISPPTGQGGVTPQGAADFTIFGRRPPLFADFFDTNLCMAVQLRKKRYQLQVRTTLVGINEP
jgi:hypothetical protein